MTAIRGKERVLLGSSLSRLSSTTGVRQPASKGVLRRLSPGGKPVSYHLYILRSTPRGYTQQGEPIPPKAFVQFEKVTLMVDERMKWERVEEPS